MRKFACYPDTLSRPPCLPCEENAARTGYEASTGRSLARAVHDKHLAGDHNTCIMTFADAMANKLQNNFGPELRPRMR
jgi:hypothetical protein